ncbi:MAG TPA: biopolymer transporter ExbD [Polyangiaceae bacterium]|nr:biopolymer transporter ExbD [Polyangiaceae bacterium]
MRVESDPVRERWRAVRSIIARDSETVPREVKADINVTPLVDVVLVLLIIFMVVTPLIASGVAVDLPRTQHHSRKPDDGRDIVISVTAEGRLYLGGRQLGGLADLGAAALREKAKFPEKGVYLKADARASFGAVRRALDTLREADINDVILGTEALEKAKGPQGE